jgi:hypothetical protein
VRTIAEPPPNAAFPRHTPEAVIHGGILLLCAISLEPSACAVTPLLPTRNSATENAPALLTPELEQSLYGTKVLGSNRCRWPNWSEFQ